MDLTEFLQTDPTFADFSQAELSVLERSLRVDRFPADHVLLKEGHKDSNLFILVEGEIQVSRKRSSGRGIDDLGMLKAGDVFGLQSLIDDYPRYSTCRTTTAVTTASLPRTAFNLLYSSHLSLAEHFQYIVARQMVRQLRQLDQAVVQAIHQGEVGPLHHVV